MFEIAIEFMVKIVDLLPGLICLYVVFDFLGSILFGKGN